MTPLRVDQVVRSEAQCSPRIALLLLGCQRLTVDIPLSNPCFSTTLHQQLQIDKHIVYISMSICGGLHFATREYKALRTRWCPQFLTTTVHGGFSSCSILTFRLA
jgi:hypothetical protein